MVKIYATTLALLLMVCVSPVDAATVVVVGEGEVAAPPDIAKVELQIRNQSKDATKAQARNVEITRKLLADLKILGIQDRDISQSFYSFSRDQNRDGKETGYYVSNSISVRISDFPLLPKLMTMAIADGVSNVGQPTYSLSDDSSLVEKARLQAYERAGIEAEKSANALGMSLGKVVKVLVGAAAISNLFAGEGMMMGGMSSKANFSDMPELQVEPVKVKYYVTVEYELDSKKSN